jgi:hypothetical protein
LNKNNEGTGKYDTGYTLWSNRNKIPHKDVRYYRYIVHYGGGSYADKYFERKHKGQITKEKWIERNRRYWSVPKQSPSQEKDTSDGTAAGKTADRNLEHKRNTDTMRWRGAPIVRVRRIGLIKR